MYCPDCYKLLNNTDDVIAHSKEDTCNVTIDKFINIGVIKPIDLHKVATVESIEEIDYDDDVFDLEVQDNHNYFANGHLAHNCHKLILEGHFGLCYKVTSTRDLMDSGALADLSINVLLLKYEDEVCQKVCKMNYQDEIDYIVSNEKRNKFIANLALDQDGNTLILFNLVKKHGIPLYDIIKAKAHERRKIFFVSGSTDVDTREQVRKITETEKNAIIVASLGTFSTGINIRNLHNIIFAAPSKSQIKILQSIGRGLRKSDDGRTTVLYDIADDFHWKSKKNYTLVHSGERIKIYAREKFKYNIYEVPM